MKPSSRSRLKKVFYWVDYARKSSEEEESRSIVNQTSVMMGIMDRIIEQDPVNEYIHVDSYSDENYTGTDSNRPEFRRLLQDIALKKVNMVIVTDLSRLSRNISESINYVQGLFVTLDVRFISYQLPELDSYMQPDRIYSLEVPMQSMMNENHCAETSMKVRRSFDRMREQGKYIGAFAPYGFKKDPNDKHYLLLDEEAVATLHMLRDWIFEGKTISICVRMLNELGILSPCAYERSKGIKHMCGGNTISGYWSYTVLKRMLLRPINVGTMVQGKQRVKSYKIHESVKLHEDEWFVVEHMAPRIFTDQEQEKIRSCIERNTRVSHKSIEKEVYLFSGFLKCADCGRSVVRKESKGYVYYMCNSYKNYKSCTKHSISHKVLESAVLSAIQFQVKVAVSHNELVRDLENAPLVDNQYKQYEKMIKKQQTDIDCISRYSRTLYEDLKNNILTKEEYKNIKYEYAEQKKTMQLILENLKEEKNRIDEAMHKEEPFMSNYMKYENITDLTRDVLQSFIDCIYIHEDKNITIRFRFKDESQKLTNMEESSSSTE